MMFLSFLFGLFLAIISCFLVGKILIKKLFEIEDSVVERDELIKRYDSHLEKIKFELNKSYNALNQISQHPLVSDEPHVVHLLSVVKSSKNSIQLLIDGLNIEDEE